MVLKTVHKSHPRARDYAEYFTSLTPEQAQQGWLRLGSFKELRRGDIIAWAKRVEPQTENGAVVKKPSGHVMLVIDKPTLVTDADIDGHNFRYVSVYVIDSSSVAHFPPETLPPLTTENLNKNLNKNLTENLNQKVPQNTRDGLGKGNVRLILDSSDNVIGYWEGTYSGEHNKEIKRFTQSDLIGMVRVMPY